MTQISADFSNHVPQCTTPAIRRRRRRGQRIWDYGYEQTDRRRKVLCDQMKEIMADFSYHTPQCTTTAAAIRRRRRGGGGRGTTAMNERTDGRTDAALYYTCNTRSTTMATG